ncbi:unnamed protein product [Cochlearia groenlandica]
MKPGSKTVGKGEDPGDIFRNQLKQQTLKMHGFPLALQVLAFKAIPRLDEILHHPNKEHTISDLKTKKIPKQVVLNHNDILEVESSKEANLDNVAPHHSPKQEQDDEVKSNLMDNSVSTETSEKWKDAKAADVTKIDLAENILSTQHLKEHPTQNSIKVALAHTKFTMGFKKMMRSGQCVCFDVQILITPNAVRCTGTGGRCLRKSYRVTGITYTSFA